MFLSNGAFNSENAFNIKYRAIENNLKMDEK